MRKLSVNKAQFEALVQGADAEERLLIESDGRFDYVILDGVEYRTAVA